MGCESSLEEMEWMATLAQKHDLHVLSDEAYYNIRYDAIYNYKYRSVILAFNIYFSHDGYTANI